MGAVYLADQQQGPPVAIKVMSHARSAKAGLRERFEREARALFGLQHPNILRVFDFGVVESMPYLVMELLQGETLDVMLERGLPGVPVALDIVAEVLSGLAFAHDHGVVHRDLKTENLFVMRSAHGGFSLKVLDFGLVKFTDDGRWGQGVQLTAMGDVFGTPAYMSPEQSLGDPVDVRTDVYSMGVVLFELLTGSWPFMCEDRIEMAQAHMRTAPPSLASVRPELEAHPQLNAIVQKALSKKREDRFQSAGEMLAAVERLRPPVRRPAAPEPARPTIDKSAGDRATLVLGVARAPTLRRLKKALLVGGIAMVCVLVALAAVFALRR